MNALKDVLAGSGIVFWASVVVLTIWQPATRRKRKAAPAADVQPQQEALDAARATLDKVSQPTVIRDAQTGQFRKVIS